MRSLAHGVARAVPFAGALAYALIVVRHGYPALRHDWAWPTNADALASMWTSSTSGWDPSGIGAPNLHLNDYLVGGALCLIGQIAGTFAALFALALGVGLVCALGAAALAGTFDAANPVTRAGAALVALFNPWVYTETIAGHTYMLLAYGALAGLLAEALRDKPRPNHAALLVALSLVQLQFFLPALAIAALAGFARRIWLPLITGLIVSAPAFVGLAAEYGAFRGVPVTLVWELSQSVQPAAAAQLGGYFAGYSQSIDGFDAWPMAVVLGIAIFGVIVSWRTNAARIVAVVALLTIAIASGLRGPLGAVLSWAFTTISASALYRELFDVLGFTAIAYVAAASLAGARSRVHHCALVACGLALFSAWIVWTPWSWWVPGGSIPRAAIAASDGTRFALTPAFQPLTFAGRGSGLDPDAYAHGSATPLNAQVPQFPVDAALARYVRGGDERWLSALSVSAVAARPWLSSDVAAHEFQTALGGLTDRGAIAGSATIPPAPLVALLPPPDVVTSVDTIGAGDVFFADAADAHGDGVPQSWTAFAALSPVNAPNRFVDAKEGWVDARLGFADDPRLGQAFGGALTTSPKETLAVTPGIPALTFVEGRLVDQSAKTVTGNTEGYRWVSIGTDVSRVRCFGLCVVAAQGRPPATATVPKRHAASVALTFRSRAPWWFEADVVAGGPGTLRLNESFDRNWIALLDGTLLTHVRLDTTVDGWLLPERTSAHQVVMIERTAAAQAVLEAVAAIWLLIVAGMLAIVGRARA